MLQVFKEKHFRLFSDFLLDRYGIYYPDEKADMLQLKLRKLMDRNGFNSFDEYFGCITRDAGCQHLSQFIDELTTHTTQFFRESSHFDYIAASMPRILDSNKRILANGEIRVWCAACSTGEEAYTLGMVLKESLPEDIQIKILATDISKKVVTAAIGGMYAIRMEEGLSRYYLLKYFQKLGSAYRVGDELKKLVTFRTFNLMENFPFKNQFDMIFCRNVMIYFNSRVQEQLIEKMYAVTAPKGLFFIGHSEGLSHKQHRFQYLMPSVYIKN